MKFKVGDKVICNIAQFLDVTGVISRVYSGHGPSVYLVKVYEIAIPFYECDLEKHPETVFNENFDRLMNE